VEHFSIAQLEAFDDSAADLLSDLQYISLREKVETSHGSLSEQPVLVVSRFEEWPLHAQRHVRGAGVARVIIEIGKPIIYAQSGQGGFERPIRGWHLAWPPEMGWQ
jgi:hypothetical protein